MAIEYKNRLVSVYDTNNVLQVIVHEDGITAENNRCSGDQVYLNATVLIVDNWIRITGDFHRSEYVSWLNLDQRQYDDHKNQFFIPEKHIYERQIREWSWRKFRYKKRTIKYVEGGSYVLRKCRRKDVSITHYNVQITVIGE